MRDDFDSATRGGHGALRSGVTAADIDAFDSDRVDDLFSVLASARRRDVLDYLNASDADADLDELVGEVLRRDDELRAVSDEDRQRTYLRLYHGDIPKMVDAGFVTFDEETKAISLTDGPDPIRTYLEGRAPNRRATN